MNWQKKLLNMITSKEGEEIALAIDTSTDEYSTELISQIVNLFEEVKKGTPLVLADYKVRDVKTTRLEIIPFYSHGRASYSETIEWAMDNDINTLFYITDVTGHVWEELDIKCDVIWLIPDEFSPKIPFGKKLNLA